VKKKYVAPTSSSMATWRRYRRQSCRNQRVHDVASLRNFEVEIVLPYSAYGRGSTRTCASRTDGVCAGPDGSFMWERRSLLRATTGAYLEATENEARLKWTTLANSCETWTRDHCPVRSGA